LPARDYDWIAHFGRRTPDKSAVVGETGMAIDAVKPGHTLSEANIYAHCEANPARSKPPRLIRFVDALPRNTTGKIHEPTLRRQFGSPKATDTDQAVAS
jgi:fatty-acyl-CoA synthase